MSIGSKPCVSEYLTRTCATGTACWARRDGAGTEIDAMLDMRDSTTYQAILRDGRITGGQRILIRLGTLKFGKLDGATLVTIEAIRDFDLLEAM
jgi:hypothetical protein